MAESMLNTSRNTKIRRRNLSEVEQWRIVSEVLRLKQNSHDKGAFQSIADELGVSKRTVYRVYLKYMDQVKRGVTNIVMDTSKKAQANKNNCRSALTDEVAANLRELNAFNGGRLSVRAMCTSYQREFQTTLPKSTMHSYLKKLKSTSHSTSKSAVM